MVVLFWFENHVFFIQAPDLRDDMYLDALNSLLISGEYPPLFSVDELDSLLQVRFASNILPQSFWFFFNAIIVPVCQIRMC